MTTLALVRTPSPRLAEGLLTHMERTPVDVELAVRQWQGYVAALQANGWSTIPVAPAADCPDSAFVEDTMVVFRDVAVIARPGADERKPETEAAAAAVAELGYRLVAIEAPGTLDGGDVLRVGRDLYVGESGRSNAAGIAQLAAAVAPHGYRVMPVPVRGCLHLKSAVTLVGPETLLINDDWVDRSHWPGLKFISVAPGEPHAANALMAGGSVIHPVSEVRTRERLEAAGLRVVPVDVSEVQKAEGGVTCCSVLFAT